MPSHFFKFLVRPQQVLMLFFLVMLTLLMAQPANAKHSDNPKLGINVGDLGKLTTAIPFTDIFKSSKGWYTSCEFNWQSGQAIDPGCTRKTSLNSREQNLLQLDGNGWVRSLPSPQDSPIFTSVTSIWKLSDHFPTGRYVVLYEGEGVMKITGDVRMAGQHRGHIEFDLLSPKRNLKLQITRTDPKGTGEYIRNIRIVPKKNEHNYRQHVFNQDYLARIRPMHSIRFMPWTNPRSNETVEWNERVRIGAPHYSGKKGVPEERMVDLANAINASPWLSIPYKASDDYMRQYAKMVKNRLRKDQKVTIEFSNEVWNRVFPAATYAARKADKLWKFPYKEVKGIKRRVLLSANWYAKRSVEMCQIWKKEFGSQRNRVQCVVGTLFSVPWLGKEILDCPLWKEANGCGRHIDAYGVGPYFGDYIAKKENRDTVKSWLNDADGGKSSLFKEILEGGLIKNGPSGGAMNLVRDQMNANKKIADKYGLPMLAYEAGQHLIRYDPPHTVKDPAVLNLFMSAQNDPRMKLAYEKYLETWSSNGGGLMLHFYGIGQPEPKNFFGMLEYLNQPSTPKYQALMSYLGTKSSYVAPVRRAIPPPVATAPVAQAPVAQAPKQPKQPRVQPQAPPASIPVAENKVQNDIPSTIVWHSLGGNGVAGWAQHELTATSPFIHLQSGVDHRLFVIWHFENIQPSEDHFFNIYAVDSRGGRKLLYGIYGKDVVNTGNLSQIYEEDINRYVGSPIQLVIETSPSLLVNVEEVRY